MHWTIFLQIYYIYKEHSNIKLDFGKNYLVYKDLALSIAAIANALELRQSCTKTLICCCPHHSWDYHQRTFHHQHEFKWIKWWPQGHIQIYVYVKGGGPILQRIASYRDFALKENACIVNIISPNPNVSLIDIYVAFILWFKARIYTQCL